MSLCHSRCESLKLQLIKPGTDSADAECGEQSSHVTTTVICVIVVLVLLIGIAVSVYFIIKKKPLLIFHQNENRNGGETLQTLNGSQRVSGKICCYLFVFRQYKHYHSFDG